MPSNMIVVNPELLFFLCRYDRLLRNRMSQILQQPTLTDYEKINFLPHHNNRNEEVLYNYSLVLVVFKAIGFIC